MNCFVPFPEAQDPPRKSSASPFDVDKYYNDSPFAPSSAPRYSHHGSYSSDGYPFPIIPASSRPSLSRSAWSSSSSASTCSSAPSSSASTSFYYSDEPEEVEQDAIKHIREATITALHALSLPPSSPIELVLSKEDKDAANLPPPLPPKDRVLGHTQTKSIESLRKRGKGKASDEGDKTLVHEPRTSVSGGESSAFNEERNVTVNGVKRKITLRRILKGKEGGNLGGAGNRREESKRLSCR